MLPLNMHSLFLEVYERKKPMYFLEMLMERPKSTQEFFRFLIDNLAAAANCKYDIPPADVTPSISL